MTGWGGGFVEEHILHHLHSLSDQIETKLLDHPNTKPTRGGGLQQINSRCKVPFQVTFKTKRFSTVFYESYPCTVDCCPWRPSAPVPEGAGAAQPHQGEDIHHRRLHQAGVLLLATARQPRQHHHHRLTSGRGDVTGGWQLLVKVTSRVARSMNDVTHYSAHRVRQRHRHVKTGQASFRRGDVMRGHIIAQVQRS